MNDIYCTRAGSCEDKPGYLQNAKGGRDPLIVQVEYLTVYLSCVTMFQCLSYLFKNYA